MEKKKKTRVLRIINRFNIGGPTYNATFLTAFLGDDYETLLVGGLPEKGEADSLYILEKYGVKPLLLEEMKREPNFKSDRLALRKLKQIIREFHPDIVHTHASKAGALGRKAALDCNVPIVVHTFHGHVFHSYFGVVKTSVFKFIERRLAKKSTAIIAISETQKKELVQDYHICEEEKMKVVPLGFDLTPFYEKRTERESQRRKFHLKDDEIAIAIIGRLAPIKNHSLFFDVAEKILERGNRNIRFFVVGDGEEKEIVEKRANEINQKYGERIHLTSWIKDIALFNSAMDIICLTSKNEGTPVSLIEAQASGVPVVSTDVGGVRDIVVHEETGFIVPHFDVDKYVDYLEKLIKDKKKREMMSQKGKDYVKERYHYTTLVKNMRKLYEELMSNK